MGQKHLSHAPKSNVKEELSPGAGGDQYHEIQLPVKRRSCTDVFCCVLFLLCIAILGVIAGFSFTMGDYRRIVFPKDSRGKICGLDYPDQKYLYFYDIMSCLDLPEVVIQFGCPTKQVCISKCPNYTWTPDLGDNEESRLNMICEGGLSAAHADYKSKSVSDLVKSGVCAPKVVPTENILGRCVPKDLFVELDRRQRLVMSNPDTEKPPPSFPSIVLGVRTFVTRLIEDLIRSWKVILACLLVAALASFLWIVLMRVCTCAMVYFTLIVFIAMFGLSTGFCFWRYVETKKLVNKPPPFFLTLDITYYLRYSTTWLVLGIISAIILFLVLLIIIFLRKKIALANRVIGEASKAIGHLPVTLFWPIVPFIFIVGAIALWLFVDLNLRSIVVSEGVYFSRATPEPKNKLSKEYVEWVFANAMKCDPSANYTQGQFCFYVRHIATSYTPWLQVYNFFMCLWLINFTIAVDQITLAGAFSTFYFSRRNRSSRSSGGKSECCGCSLFCGCCLLASTFGSALLYHSGSLALGSLLISLLWLLRAILLKVERKLKATNNEVARFFIKCLCCCFWCLDKFLRFLNKNAFIMMAIYGHSFCRSAHNAFNLILRNVVRVFVVEKITDFILFVGKLSVSAASAYLAYVYLSGILTDHLSIVPEQKLHLNYMIVPILVIALGSFLVAKAFFSVYEMGVDTIFICACEDLERNDGSAEKPYYMSKSMMQTLKRPDAEDNPNRASAS